MWLKTLILIFSFCIASDALSEKKLKIAFGASLAPWVMADTQSGILLDIIRGSLEPLGYKILPVYYPYARRIKSFKQEQVDGTCDMNENITKDAGLTGFLSDEAYVYENFAFSLKEKGYHFKHLNELRLLRLLSWQGAISTLGGEYAEMATNNPFYNEHHDQALQIKMLFIKRVDVIQLDGRIFNYYRTQVGSEGKIDTSAEVDRFPLFGKNPSSFLFRSAEVRNDFNIGLNRLKESGEYTAIFDRY